MTENESKKNFVFEYEIKHLLAGRPRLFKLAKEGEDDFYFDSTDLVGHKDDFIEMRKNGWEINEEVSVDLPAYLRPRARAIADAGFEPSGWGYRKK